MWPQDILVNPISNQRNVDKVSAETTNREYFAYVHDFDFTTVGGIFKKVHPVEQLNNFWITNIVMLVFRDTGVGDPVPVQFGRAEFMLMDIEQSYVPMSCSAAMLRRAGGVNRGNRMIWPMPYVIRAGQGFMTSLTIPALASWTGTGRGQISIEGWKDYSY